MMYKSQFQKITPYDWFCGPGSQIHIVYAASVNGVNLISYETSLIPAAEQLYRRQQCHDSDQFSSDVVKC